MARRALLIGSETSGLRGCHADVELMRATLAARGFDPIDVRIGTDATRAGILDGFERLLGATGGDDAVVVYYSGHGGRITRPDFEERRAAGRSTHFQFIVPTDMDESDRGDFRGILSEELTVLQRRLTDAFRSLGTVPNVTTILDCCHSGHLARDAEATRKSIDAEAKAFRIRGIREHLASLGPGAELEGAATNPDAVRIVACQPEQSAFELPSVRGGRHGALTDALVTLLDGVGPAAVPWGIIGDLVRRRVRALVPEQRPEVEGPAERVLFAATSVPVHSALPVSNVGGALVIEAAALLGIDRGDEFDLIAPGGDRPAGSAVVASIAAGNAVLRTEVAGDGAADVVAVPTRVSAPKVTVHIDAPAGLDRDALADAIVASTRLGIAPERSGAMVSVADAGGEWQVRDRVGAPWRTATFPDTAAGRLRLARELDALAVGQRLLDLPSGSGASALATTVQIDFAAVEDGARRPLSSHGERLPAGAHVALTLRNTGPDVLFAWVFDVGVSGRSALLTNASPSGMLLGAAGSEDDTLDLWGADGEALFWPPDVPTEPAPGTTERARPETFVVLLADRRSDLSALASGTATARGTSRSALDAILAEARSGTREVAPVVGGEPPLRYRLDPVEFLLDPG